jgi:hypothetical protein
MHYHRAEVQPKLARTIVLEIWMNIPRVVKVATYMPLLLLRWTIVSVANLGFGVLFVG